MQDKFFVCKEMQALRDWLDKEGIAWEDKSADYGETWICRTHFWVGGNKWSVINGYGSYGGYDPLLDRDERLLECMRSEMDEPEGWLTAADVIKMMEDARCR